MTFRQGAGVQVAAAAPSRTPRRVLSAFVLGAAISVMGLAALAAGVSGARGLFVPPETTAAGYAPSSADRISIVRYQGSSVARHRDYEDDGEDDSRRSRRHKTLRASLVGGAGGHDAVCVRLCDGYFFPLPTAASDVVSQDAACNSLCPDAPTEVFYRNGSDSIEGAVSAGGKPYTSLPVSLHYRASYNETCSCHRDAVAYAPLKDATLKHGDAIMTPAGFVVFRGVEGATHHASDFSALSTAGLPSNWRNPLQQMERASLSAVHPTLRDWLLTQNTSAPLASGSSVSQFALRSPPSRSTPSAGGASGKIHLVAWRGRDE